MSSSLSVSALSGEMKRQQESMLARVEKQCLVWLARRMPRWVNPDHLTLLALAAMLMAGLSSAVAERWPAGLLITILWLAVHWFGDSLDGTLARVREQQRPRYGFYVDHMADSFSVLFLLGGLGLSGYMSPSVAVALLVVYLLFSINLFLATYSLGVFQLSFWLFGPTELRILLAAGLFYAWLRPTVAFLGADRLFFDVAGGIGALVMAGVLVASVARNTLILYRKERV